MSSLPSRCSSHVSSICSSLLSINSVANFEALHQENASQVLDIKALTYCVEALTAAIKNKDALLQVAEARNGELEVWLSASEAHATIRNFENQELRRLQGAEKTGTGKKCKINMEGCIITPLNSVALFAQQDTECQEKEAADEAKKKSKMDAMLVREHQHVLTS